MSQDSQIKDLKEVIPPAVLMFAALEHHAMEAIQKRPAQIVVAGMLMGFLSFLSAHAEPEEGGQSSEKEVMLDTISSALTLLNASIGGGTTGTEAVTLADLIAMQGNTMLANVTPAIEAAFEKIQQFDKLHSN